MLCKSAYSKFMDGALEMWTMEEYTRCGSISESSKDEPQLRVKQRPWWPFIPLTHYVPPLLYCEIGGEKLIFELLRDVTNEYIVAYSLGEESI